MRKKLFSILFIIIGLFIISSCNTDLDEYRDRSKGFLDAHLETKDQYSYSEDNWDLINNYVIAGKLEIEEAIGASTIDKVVKKYKELIDKVNTKADLSLILPLFDLTDPKQPWDGSTEIPFKHDRVYVTLKKTTTYPELTVDHFYISNLDSLRYSMLEPSVPNPNFRQLLVIYLKNHGKQEVLQAIAELEEIEFVRSVTPDYIYGVEPN